MGQHLKTLFQILHSFQISQKQQGLKGWLPSQDLGGGPQRRCGRVWHRRRGSGRRRPPRAGWRRRRLVERAQRAAGPQHPPRGRLAAARGRPAPRRIGTGIAPVRFLEISLYLAISQTTSQTNKGSVHSSGASYQLAT